MSGPHPIGMEGEHSRVILVSAGRSGLSLLHVDEQLCLIGLVALSLWGLPPWLLSAGPGPCAHGLLDVFTQLLAYGPGIVGLRGMLLGVLFAGT